MIIVLKIQCQNFISLELLKFRSNPFSSNFLQNHEHCLFCIYLSRSLLQSGSFSGINTFYSKLVSDSFSKMSTMISSYFEFKILQIKFMNLPNLKNVFLFVSLIIKFSRYLNQFCDYSVLHSNVQF